MPEFLILLAILVHAVLTLRVTRSRVVVKQAPPRILHVGPPPTANLGPHTHQAGSSTDRRGIPLCDGCGMRVLG